MRGYLDEMPATGLLGCGRVRAEGKMRANGYKYDGGGKRGRATDG